jgi:acyl-CoA thioesterase FadM
LRNSSTINRLAAGWTRLPSTDPQDSSGMSRSFNTRDKAMKLWFRLLFTFLAGRWRKPAAVMDACVTPFRVMPSDLDLLGHVNNGVYFQLMDLARVDFLLRTGYWKKFKQRDWFPVAAAETIQFHSNLRLLQKFVIETRWIGVEARTFFISQRVFRDRERPPVAEAVIRGLLVSRKGGTVPMSAMLEAAGNPRFAQPMAPWVVEWAQALDERRKELAGADQVRRAPPG